MKNPLLITIATMLIWSACKRDEKKEPEVHYSYLSAEQRNKTPYFNNPAFDTLTFLSNKGDTLIFAKLKTDSFFIMTGGRPFPDHPGIYTYHQTLRNTYQTLKGNGKFEVRHVKFGSSYAISTYGQDFIEITFNNSIYFFYDYWVDSKTYPTYKEAIQINGRNYINVFINYKNVENFSSDTISADFQIINTQYGAFYFKYKQQNQDFILLNK